MFRKGRWSLPRMFFVAFVQFVSKLFFSNLYWDFNGWACNPVPGPQDAQRRVAIIVTTRYWARVQVPATGQDSSLSGNVATDIRLGWLTVWAVKVSGLNSPLMPLPLLLRDFARSRDNSTTQREFRISANHSARSFNCGTVLDTENIKWKLF